MKFFLKEIFLAINVFCVAQNLWAAPQKTSETAKFAGSAEITRSTSLYDLKNGQKVDALEYALGLSYIFSLGTIATKFSYAQNLNDSSEDASDVDDTFLNFAFKPVLLTNKNSESEVHWSSSVTAVVPLAKATREVEELQTALILKTGLKTIFSDKSNFNGLGFDFNLSLGKNFHQYETDKNGLILNSISSNQELAMFYKIQNLAFTLQYKNMIRWSYADELRQSFKLTEDITYSFLDAWSVSFGHTNSANSLKPNGQDSNISVFAEESSILYLGLAYSF